MQMTYSVILDLLAIRLFGMTLIVKTVQCFVSDLKSWMNANFLLLI